MSFLNRRLLLAAGLALGTALAGPAFAADNRVTIAFQTGVDPAKVAQAEGAYEKATGWAIDWRKFDSGADVIAAIASGDVQIGYVGSSPLAAAASRKLPIQTIFIAALLGDAEELVVSDKSGIKEPKDLVGKKIGVPFVSTSHYSLLAALKHWGIDSKSVEVLNLRPPELAAAYARGDVDGGYVWDPALGKLKEGGKVLVSSADVAKWGAPTFDAWIVRTDFAAAHPDVVTDFVKVTGESYKAYRDNPDAWTATSRQATEIARITGSRPEDVPGLLKSNVWPLLPEQSSADLLGGGSVKAIADTAAFLVEQKKIPAALPDYSAYVAKTYVQQALTKLSSQ
ncbi:taurine ABC transporter substrate-binding protein [Labrys monachus]|uniref:Taurine transport system substrate-binding protein n=1 Tax=Labrys monachus TaxID=217067 RepID=A0ABU0FJU7_9HYPH|nr:taurine ABC transporter substrate-binding protein [Labrys monachus]MDQ0394353.1 taurine transport system substrate-binding protein [Labrys monachus]